MLNISEYVGMSKSKKYVNKVGMRNRNKIPYNRTYM